MDDDERNLLAISEVLSVLDAEVICASSGMEALRHVLRRDFCAILMDVRMPGMDGYETASIIRQRERSRRIPVIFLTAYDKDDTHIFRGYSAGAVDFVFKPVEPVVLRAKVSVFIELHKQSDEIRRQAELERRLLQENIQVRAERTEAEHQLRSSERREALIIRSLPIALYEAELDMEGPRRAFLHDDSVKRLLGFDASEFVKDPTLWESRVHPEDRPGLQDAQKQTSDTGEFSTEYRWRCADGAYRYFLDQWVSATAGSPSRRRVFGMMFDVSERRTLEQQLLHAQKIDAIGKLTGGIVHDFNNMLTVVIGNLDRMRRTEGLDALITRRIEHALQGALHCRDMTKRLLGFARQQSMAPQAINLNSLIHDLADLVTRTLGERIDIRKELGSGLWQVYVDPGQVEAAILNLLVNARDAMPMGGRVSIRTRNLPKGEGARLRSADLAPGDYVVLDVADTGVGMDAEVLKRACEPFFTTKEAGRGTGLGLSTIHSFAKQAGGTLSIESKAGKGTRVRICLPAYNTCERPADVAGREEHEALPRAREQEQILVVEDDEAVRRTACNALRELGYRVLEAETATAALDILNQTDDIRLLFTDLVMPGSANGYELAEMALEQKPELRILFTSAYGDAVVATIGGAPIEPFLAKPYRDHELAQAVHDALE